MLRLNSKKYSEDVYSNDDAVLQNTVKLVEKTRCKS